jgi:hypothetical protein
VSASHCGRSDEVARSQIGTFVKTRSVTRKLGVTTLAIGGRGLLKMFYVCAILSAGQPVWAQYSPPTNGLVSWWHADGDANDSVGGTVWARSSNPFGRRYPRLLVIHPTPYLAPSRRTSLPDLKSEILNLKS